MGPRPNTKRYVCLLLLDSLVDEPYMPVNLRGVSFTTVEGRGKDMSTHRIIRSLRDVDFLLRRMHDLLGQPCEVRQHLPRGLRGLRALWGYAEGCRRTRSGQAF